MRRLRVGVLRRMMNVMLMRMLMLVMHHLDIAMLLVKVPLRKVLRQVIEGSFGLSLSTDARLAGHRRVRAMIGVHQGLEKEGRRGVRHHVRTRLWLMLLLEVRLLIHWMVVA